MNLMWPQFPADFGGVMTRRLAELQVVENASEDETGLIEGLLLPLNGMVLFPHMLTPLLLDDSRVARALDDAAGAGETMIAVAQRGDELGEPGMDTLFSIGTEAAVGKMVYTNDGIMTVLAQGRRRVQILDIFSDNGWFRVKARPLGEEEVSSTSAEALMRTALDLFEQCVQLNPGLPEEAYVYALNIDAPGWLADLLASSLQLSLEKRQTYLEMVNPVARLEGISADLAAELNLLNLEDEIQQRVQMGLDQSQREVYLRERLQAIEDELGESMPWVAELEELRTRVTHLPFPEETEKRALQEIERLKRLQPLSPEAGILRTYLEWLTELPWTEQTVDNLDLAHAEQILEQRHHGLSKAKDRILEYIAVQRLAPRVRRQPILCFVGPPGTGKTSLGQSIADALERKFIRISLGGIRDEAEIRGHRRTYVGAMPGRILQAMRRVGTQNPLFMLDEIDKLGQDFRGDPSSALLEVLDPEQNHAFSDHYLEVPYDLSHVMFITTANTLEPIPPALEDRLEVIDFPGYVEEEKILIARKYLIPKQMEENGLSSGEFMLTRDALQAMVREYTWEAGVRNLERVIGTVCRKIARRKVQQKDQLKRVTSRSLPRLLGPPEITPREPEAADMQGAAIGLAWTESGGEMLLVEALAVEGKGNLELTGQMGEVMQESAQAALTYIRSRAKKLHINPTDFEKKDLHIHVPEGAIPKDGPSAGITMAVALVSALTGNAVSKEIAMTGEITLRGLVLPVGGVREKVLAAHRLCLSEVILPQKNKKDLVDIPASVKRRLRIHLVSHMDEVLVLAMKKNGSRG